MHSPAFLVAQVLIPAFGIVIALALLAVRIRRDEPVTDESLIMKAEKESRERKSRYEERQSSEAPRAERSDDAAPAEEAPAAAESADA